MKTIFLLWAFFAVSAQSLTSLRHSGAKKRLDSKVYQALLANADCGKKNKEATQGKKNAGPSTKCYELCKGKPGCSDVCADVQDST